MLEYLLKLIKSICGGGAQVKVKSNNKCFNDNKCCNNTDVSSPGSKMVKIINVFTCASKHDINKIKIPFKKTVTV